MTSSSLVRSMDYVRSYRNMMQEMNKYHRVIPRQSSRAKMYKPTNTVSTTEASPVFVPLFYAGEKNALGCWEKTIGTGYIKRRLDEEDRSYHTLEMTNPRNSLGTFISAPKSALQALHVTLPNLVIAMKNYRRNFGFDVLIMDSNAYRRRFSFATWYNPNNLKKYSFMCQIPLRLEIGWNEIHVNFNDLVKSTYKTNYVETIRIQIYSNCKLRQVFYCDDRIIRGEVPIPSMRDFGNIRIIPPDYGPRTHPDNVESGPEKKRHYPHIDPPAAIPPTRLEMDLKCLQRKRFTEVSKQRLSLQPYKTYFRDLLHEEKQKKKLTNAIQAALKEELTSKAVKTDGDKLFDGGHHSQQQQQNTANNNNTSPLPGASSSALRMASTSQALVSASKNILRITEEPSTSVTLIKDKDMHIVNVEAPSALPSQLSSMMVNYIGKDAAGASTSPDLDKERDSSRTNL